LSDKKLGDDKSNAFKKHNARTWLIKVSRISAWALLAVVIVLLFSGWGITQTGVIFNITFGLVDRRAADMIHRATNIPLAIFFLAHVMANIRLAVTSRRSYLVRLTNVILVVVGIGLMIVVVYLEFFRRGG
jgi:hypothetical protein